MKDEGGHVVVKKRDEGGTYSCSLVPSVHKHGSTEPIIALVKVDGCQRKSLLHVVLSYGFDNNATFALLMSSTNIG